MIVIFNYFEQFLLDTDHKAIYVLALICIAMILDFFSGLLAAKINPAISFQSKIGINGILRKIASIILLLFFIPVAPLIPGGMGVGLLYVLYVGYLLMELTSILENYQKMGLHIELFETFLSYLKDDSKKEK